MFTILSYGTLGSDYSTDGDVGDVKPLPDFELIVFKASYFISNILALFLNLMNLAFIY